MRNRRMALVGLLVVVTVVAFALGLGMLVPRVSAQTRSVHVNGPGGKQCSEMTSNLQMDRPTWRAFYTSYVEGFFSGANYVSYFAKQPNTSVGFDITPDEQWAAIEQYCAANPTKGIHQAVEGLYSRLVAR